MNSPIAHDVNRSLLGSPVIEISELVRSFDLKLNVIGKNDSWTAELESEKAVVGLKQDALDPLVSSPSGHGSSRNAAIAQLCKNLGEKMLIVETGGKRERILLPETVVAA